MRCRILFLCVVLGGVSCKTLQQNSSGAGSNLAEVEFKGLPKAEEMKSFFGPRADIAKMNAIHLVVQPVDQNCTNATMIDERASYSQLKIAAKLNAKCDYKLRLAIGEALADGSTAVTLETIDNVILASTDPLIAKITAKTNAIYLNHEEVILAKERLIENSRANKPLSISVPLKITKYGKSLGFVNKPGLGQFTLIAFEQFAKGTSLNSQGFKDSEYSNGVGFTDQISFMQFWNTVTTDEAPGLDFSQFQLVAVAKKFNMWGYSVEISDIVKIGESKIEVVVSTIEPGNKCYMQGPTNDIAYHLVRIPRTNLPITFVQQNIAKDCE